MRKHRRSLATACAVAAMALVAAACGGGGGSGAASAKNVTAKEVTSISMFGGEPGTVINVNTNWFTKYVEKKYGIKFSFSTVPSADVTTKQPLLLASGNYPDVIFGGTITQSDALKYGTQGVFIPLNSLIQKYAPNLWHAIQNDPGFKQDVTAPNGKIYALPAYNFCFHCFWPYNFYVNVKDLNAYHLNMPTTTAQFENVLEVFKQHGLTPLTGANLTAGGYNTDPITFLMNAFIPFNGGLDSPTSQLFDVKDGKALFVPAQPGWKQGLEYIHGLFAKGLVSPQALTQQPTQISQLISNQKVGVVPNGAIETAITGYGAKNSHYLDWLSIPALKGPGGVQSAAFAGGVTGLTFALTNKSDTAEQIKMMRLLNFMNTPTGAQMEDFGPQGKDWNKAKPGEKGLIPQQALFTTNFNAFYSGNSEQNEGWNQWGPIDQSEPWRNLTYSPASFTPNGGQTNNQLTTQVSLAGHQAPQQYPPAVWVPSADTQTFSTEQTNIDNYVTQWTDEFVTGQKSVAADWGTYLSGLNHLGLGAYVSLAQKVMGHPENATVAEYQSSPSDTKYLIQAGPVPPLIKKYLLQQGVPAGDFKGKS